MFHPLTKRKKWILATALAASLIVTLWLSSSSPPPSIALTLGFEGFKNHEGDRVAVFDLTNHHNSSTYFLVAIERKTRTGWPVYPDNTPLPHGEPSRVTQDSMLD